jgi:hypothetical protein
MSRFLAAAARKWLSLSFKQFPSNPYTDDRKLYN